MITCTQNNFGTAEIIFHAWQHDKFCALSGQFVIDPENQDYKNAHELTISLPQDFMLQQSAISSAILMSSHLPGHEGTALRCWINNRILHIEKLSQWDSYGPITIIINSMFTELGERGYIAEWDTSIIYIDGKMKTSPGLSIRTINWDFVSLIFDKFLRSSIEKGIQSIHIEALSPDTEVSFPIICEYPGRKSKIPGSPMLPAKIRGDRLYFVMPEGDSDFIRKGAFFNIAGIRNTLNKFPIINGTFKISLDDITPISNTNISHFILQGNAEDMSSIDAKIGSTDNNRLIRLGVKTYPKTASEYLPLTYLSRSSRNTGFRVCYKELVLAYSTKEIHIVNWGKEVFSEEEIFGTGIYCFPIKIPR